MSNSHSITHNFLYNILLTLSTYIAQLIVYPYVSRVLGVENMGVIGFVNKTIDIFLIFSTLGINTVGIREIAAAKSNQGNLDKVFSSFISFTFVSTLIVSFIYLGTILWVAKFNIYSTFFIIGLSKLIFSTFLIQWFYQGIEDFKFITLRTLGIKILYIISVFVFVKNKDSAISYFLLTTFVVVFNSIVNWVFSRRYVKYKFCLTSIILYIKPILSYGVYAMLNATFSTCNYLFLGFLTSETQIGYYYTAENFYYILLTVISSFTTVMLPRMSSLLSKGDKDSFNRLINKSFDTILTICMPISIFGFAFASCIIDLFAGEGYQGAVVPLQIMILLVVINGLNQVFILQVATPLKLDKEILLGTLVAAIISIPLNYVMIVKFGAVGCTFVLVLSVVLANTYPIMCLLKRHLILLPVNLFLRHIVYAIPYVLICSIAYAWGDRNELSMIISAISFLLYFCLLPGRFLFLSIFDSLKRYKESYLNHR